MHIDLMLDFTNIPTNAPVVLRLDGGNQGGSFELLGEGLALAPADSSVPTSIAALTVSRDTITVTTGDEASFTIVVGVACCSDTVLAGTVTMGHGSVTVSQVGSRIGRTLSASQPFELALVG